MKAYSFKERDEAETLYIAEGKNLHEISEATGIPVQTLSRWSIKYNWRAKREAYEKVFSETKWSKMFAANATNWRIFEALEFDGVKTRVHAGKGADMKELKPVSVRVYIDLV